MFLERKMERDETRTFMTEQLQQEIQNELMEDKISSENNVESFKLTFDLRMRREPEEVLLEAKKAAQALKSVISSKTHSVMFNGEQYLEFEDWQTLAKFYGITAKCESTKYVEFDAVKGFEARAVAIQVATGHEISGAEAMCLNDERNWSNKPLFQLRSMAQTRACAKALRNILAWVVVLAGYKPTPAEEMENMAQWQTNTELNQTKVVVTTHQDAEVIARFLGVNGEYSEEFGPDGYKKYLRNSKGQSPTIERIVNFRTPKQLAWLKKATVKMEEELKRSKE